MCGPENHNSLSFSDRQRNIRIAKKKRKRQEGRERKLTNCCGAGKLEAKDWGRKKGRMGDQRRSLRI